MKKQLQLLLVCIITIGLITISCSKDDITNPTTETGTLTDVDGNNYKWVRIGKQKWMVENLKVTHYPNGVEIPIITDNSVWSNLSYTDDACCFYDNNNQNTALYTYTAAINVCPTGWHLPTDDEWKTLEIHLGMSQSVTDLTGHRGTNEGAKLKTTYGWYDNGNGIDEYGFSALPEGRRTTAANQGIYRNINENGYWWTATEYEDLSAYGRLLDYEYNTIYRNHFPRVAGFSIRCVKD